MKTLWLSVPLNCGERELACRGVPCKCMFPLEPQEQARRVGLGQNSELPLSVLFKRKKHLAYLDHNKYKTLLVLSVLPLTHIEDSRELYMYSIREVIEDCPER